MGDRPRLVIRGAIYPPLTFRPIGCIMKKRLGCPRPAEKIRKGKKHTMQKRHFSSVLSLTLAALMTLSLFSGCKKKTPALTEDDTDSVDPAKDTHLIIPDSPVSDFTYTVSDQNRVEITGYTGSDTKISIPAYIEGRPVTSIDRNAFMGCAFTDVKIPDSVTFIGSLAFANCTSLRAVELPDSLTRLESFENTSYGSDYWGLGAFCGCTSLKSVWLPDKVHTVGPYSFEGCTGLESVRIPAGLTQFESAFAYSSVRKVTLEDGLEQIDEMAFYHSGLEEVVLPASVKKIDSMAFSRSNLTQVAIPGTVESVEYCAFYGCERLKSLTIGEGVTSLGYSAFEDTGLKGDVTLPMSLRTMNETVFADCPDLERLIFLGDAPEGEYMEEFSYTASTGRYSVVYQPGAEGFTSPLWSGYPAVEAGAEPEFFTEGDFVCLETDGGITLLQYRGDSQTPEIPETVREKPVTTLGRKCFAKTEIRVAILPDSLKNVGEMAFYGCNGLITVYFPEDLEIIGDGAFTGCTKLELKALPAGLKQLGKYSLAYCDAIKELDLSDLNLEIGSDAFTGSGLVMVDLPKNLKAIPDGLFFDCENLAVLHLPDSIKSIGDSAFGSCLLLKELTLPQGLERIGDSVFDECRVTSLTLPDSMKEIGRNAFMGCNLTELNLGSGITELGDGALAGLRLESLVIPAGVTKMSNDVFASYDYDGEKLWDYYCSITRLKFEGDAPKGFYYAGDDIIICHHEGASGFTGENWENVTMEIW